MKKLILGITVLVVLSMVGTTVFAGSSAPKSLCYQQGSGGFQTMMTLKSLGTIKTVDGPVKHYATHGTQLHPGMWLPSAIAGTATFMNGILRFTHVSFVRSDGEPGTSPAMSWQISTEGSFNTATGTGMVTDTAVRLAHSGGTAIVEDLYNSSITAIPCEDLSINPELVNSTASSSGAKYYHLIPE